MIFTGPEATNCFLATKVSFFNEIYQICRKLGIDYDEVMKGVILDGRIGNSHYTVPGTHGLGFAGSCLIKDINALIKKAIELEISPTVMLGVVEKNLEVRGEEKVDSK